MMCVAHARLGVVGDHSMGHPSSKGAPTNEHFSIASPYTLLKYWA